MLSTRYVPLRLPIEVADRLQAEANTLSLSRSAIVTAALSAYLPGLTRAAKAASSAARSAADRKGPR